MKSNPYLRRSIEVFVLVGLLTLTAHAAEKIETQPVKAKTEEATKEIQQLAIVGKVVVVDQKHRLLTLEVDGKLQRIQLGPKVEFLKKGKRVQLADLLPGQTIVLKALVTAQDNVEVVSITIGPTKAQVEAAGLSLDQGQGSTSKGPAPFFDFKNPANQLGPTVSPNN